MKRGIRHFERLKRTNWMLIGAIVNLKVGEQNAGTDMDGALEQAHYYYHSIE